MSQAAITSFLPAEFYSPILTKSQRYVCDVINSIKREAEGEACRRRELRAAV